MHFDTDGVYTLLYTAEDGCGNETVEEREVEVYSLNTVLYTDGTLIINEKSIDRDANIALHGAVTNEYIPFDPNGATDVDKYIFSVDIYRPWHAQRGNVLSVEVGSAVAPTSMANWFDDFANCDSMNFSNLDTSHTADMESTFRHCKTPDAGNLDTSQQNHKGDKNEYQS